MTSAAERADALVAAWQEARARGEGTSLDALLDENADLTEELRDRAKALLAMESAFTSGGQALEPGGRLGPFRVLQLLGQGGMGAVYKAEVEEPNRGLEEGHLVALKLVHAHLLASGEYFGRFLREAELGRRIRHPNLVRTHGFDAILAGGVPHRYLVMDYVHGQTLRQLLSELDVVPEDLCQHIAQEVAKGLAAMHEAGAVHRDLKPENVIITDDHEVRIMDLGVAQATEGALSITKSGQFLGSIQYAAPEQFRGTPLDGRADLHALGVVLYELSTGEHPYGDEDAHVVVGRVLGSTPRRAGDRNPQLSAFFEEVIHNLLAKEREQRFESASALADVLCRGEESAWWTERAAALRSETGRPLRRIRIPRETSLYGRDEDLAHLHELYDKARSGAGQVLLLEGEAGIGKTRLVDEFVGRLQRDGEDLDFLFGSYAPGGAATAAGAFSEAYREHFGAEGLEGALESYLRSVPLLVPAFAALLRGEVAPPDVESLTKQTLQTAFARTTQSLAARRTIVLFIDDLHFAPEEGRGLFTALALAIPEHRVLLIGTTRPAVPDGWTAEFARLEHAVQRGLPRLGPKDLGKLFRDVFRSDRLADELGWRIAEKSDGNPFFAFEIIRGLKEGQFITQRPDGTWVTTKVVEEIEIPASVLDLVNARVADLSDEERELLDVASCIGLEFDGTLLARVVGRPRIPTLRALGHMERKYRLVRASGRRHVFDHHQVQEALYGSLSDVLKEEYHAATAIALEERETRGTRTEEQVRGESAVQLSRHLLLGGLGGRVVPYLSHALDFLAACHRNEESIELASRALDEPGVLERRSRLEILLRVSTRQWILGRSNDMKRVLSEAQDLVETTSDEASVAKLERGWGSLYWRLGRYEAAQEHFEKSLKIARGIQDRRAEGEAVHGLACTLDSQGRYSESIELSQRSVSIAREAGERVIEARALSALGGSYFRLEKFEKARGLLERALASARSLGLRAEEASACAGLGLTLGELHQAQEAEDYTKQALALAREIGDRLCEARAHGHLGGFHYSAGRYEEAKAHLEEQCAISKEVGDSHMVAMSSGNLGSLLSALGLHGEAERCHGRYLKIARELGLQHSEGYALHGLASVAWERGAEEEALDQVRQALEVRREIDHRDGIATSLLSLGTMLWWAGDAGGACGALQEAEGILRGGPSKDARAQVLAMLACLPQGDHAAAEAAVLELGSDGHWIEESYYYLWRATARPEHLFQAKRNLDDRVAASPEAYQESIRWNPRLHRKIMEAWEEHGERTGGGAVDAD